MSPNEFENRRTKVVIPARYASSRFPGKPLVELAGVPMVARVYRKVAEALPESEVLVAADDERVADFLDAQKIPCVMTSTGHESGTDRIEEVATKLAWGDEDLIVNVQGDEPLVPSNMLQTFAGFCSNRPKLEMATIACPVESSELLHDSNLVKVIQNKKFQAIYFSRHCIPFFRDEPVGNWPCEIYLRHIGIYAYRRSILRKITENSACQLELAEKLEQLRAIWLGVAIDIMQWGESPPHGVDTPEDAERVGNLLKQGEAYEY
ncbi:3-deoxy-manno-octulosonate cytidylyltransferase [Litchfieldella rifensis]|uniref:3-deoxy-manno-octulosonate cytidylyltransferase n=1 Tax=Litchfieldella rifensis TaxID=762643 RepID=A0ABV7LUM3_9GAMM